MNILIIGLGSIGRKHVSAIRQVQPDAIIYALRSSKTTDEIQAVHNVYSINDIKHKLDFVIISNPTQLHADTIKHCLNLNCPLFIEKPALGNLESANTLIDEVSKRGTITYIGCNMRFHPSIEFLKKYIDTKNMRINEVNIYCGSYLPDWRPGKDFRTIYSANLAMGGGVHLDLIHEVDYCYWLFGKPTKVTSIKRSVSSLNIDSTDYAQFNLFYPKYTANIKVNYYRRDAKREIELVTDEDTLCVDLIRNKIYSSLSGNVLFECPFNISETYTKQLEYFINHIRDRQQPMNDLKEGIDVLKMVLDA